MSKPKDKKENKKVSKPPKQKPDVADDISRRYAEGGRKPKPQR
jgi:hypothetical protein